MFRSSLAVSHEPSLTSHLGGVFCMPLPWVSPTTGLAYSILDGEAGCWVVLRAWIPGQAACC